MPHRKLIPFLYGIMPKSVPQTMGKEMFSEAAKAQFPWLNPTATIDPSLLAAYEDAVDALTLRRPVEVCCKKGLEFEDTPADAAGGSANANSQ